MQTLKPCPFCNGSAEIVQDSGNFFARCENSACPPAPQTPLVDDANTAVSDWNTRPAALVEGLERYGQNWHDEMEPKAEGDYVLHSQAEAIIAAKDAKAEKFADEIKEAAYEAWPEASDVGSDAPDIIRQLGQERSECLTEIEDLKNKLYRSEANNTALTARVKELEQINSNLMGDDEDKPRYTTKRLKLEIARATEALETQLAAAKKDAATWEANFKALNAKYAARAALEDKP